MYTAAACNIVMGTV